MFISNNEAQLLVDIVIEAGNRIMPYFREEHSARKKSDHSPVTDADIAAHEYIIGELAKHFPDITVISEEDAVHDKVSKGEAFFLVDPLDGTRSFVKGEDEFTVNIGLVEKNRPVHGVVGVPARGLVYQGGVNMKPERRKVEASEWEPIHVREPASDGVVLTRSRSWPSTATQEFLDSLTVKDTIPASSSVKFCWVAEGSADIYPRFGRTMEWDTAAGHAILNAAGGRIEREDGGEFLYGKEGFENPGFIAWGY